MEKKSHGRFAGFDLDKRGTGPTDIGSSLSQWLAKQGHCARKRDVLCDLWRNWQAVMGDDLAERARPLGSRGDVILIGGDDQCVMQELVYEEAEILRRANGFLKEERFHRVELHLLMGRTDLRRVDTTVVPKRSGPERPESLGRLRLPPSSPAAAAYEAYLRLFDRQDGGRPQCGFPSEDGAEPFIGR